MTVTPQPNTEPTLKDIAQQLTELRESDDRLAREVDRLAQQVERFNDRFSNYQQSTQWVVQLAFTLIASATITVIVTAVLKQ